MYDTSVCPASLRSYKKRYILICKSRIHKASVTKQYDGLNSLKFVKTISNIFVKFEYWQIVKTELYLVIVHI